MGLRVLIALCTIGLALAAKITSLPGFNGKIPFNQYAGYITVDESHGRSMFYWLVESQNSPSTDPLVLWLNGGPGCSSLIGLLTENGPFTVQPGGETLEINPYSWNNIANVLYLESPAGVGFSYSNTTSDYVTDDQKTAEDNYQFLLNFFKEHTRYANRAFYITGESWGGHYVPMLANQVLVGNQKGNPRINLKGIAVGNGVTVYDIDFNSFIPTYFSHALISLDTYNNVLTTCKGNYYNTTDAECSYWLQVATNETGDIDPYDIYEPICTSSNEGTSYRRSYELFHPVLKHLKNRGTPDPYTYPDPCIDDYITDYLNIGVVQKAIHARPPTDNGNSWQECSEFVGDNWGPASPTMIPYYQSFFKAGINVLVYSGDADTVVPYLGTQQWINNLGLKVIQRWRPWGVDEQVSGYVTLYDKHLTFVTVKGSGHMVPYFKPAQAFGFFSRWLLGQPI